MPAEVSRENGRLGGRLPKEITEAKKQLIELENKLFKAKITDSKKAEMDRISKKIDDWIEQKKNNKLK